MYELIQTYATNNEANSFQSSLLLLGEQFKEDLFYVLPF